MKGFQIRGPYSGPMVFELTVKGRVDVLQIKVENFLPLFGGSTYHSLVDL